MLSALEALVSVSLGSTLPCGILGKYSSIYRNIELLKVQSKYPLHLKIILPFAILW